MQNIKNGQSLFENTKVIEEYHVPLLKEAKLRENLIKYVDKSLIEVSVKESNSNLALIESLSPSRRNRQSPFLSQNTSIIKESSLLQ